RLCHYSPPSVLDSVKVCPQCTLPPSRTVRVRALGSRARNCRAHQRGSATIPEVATGARPSGPSPPDDELDECAARPMMTMTTITSTITPTIPPTTISAVEQPLLSCGGRTPGCGRGVGLGVAYPGVCCGMRGGIPCCGMGRGVWAYGGGVWAYGGGVCACWWYGGGVCPYGGGVPGPGTGVPYGGGVCGWKGCGVCGWGVWGWGVWACCGYGGGVCGVPGAGVRCGIAGAGVLGSPPPASRRHSSRMAA